MTRLLLVEDSPGDARLFAEMLRDIPNQPFTLTTVEQLAQALVVADDHDVVFLDLSLPDAHGLSVLTRMIDATHRPVVVLTGNEDDALAVQAVKAGAQDYLRKSDISPALVARVAWYAIERNKNEEQRRRLAVADQASRRARLLSSVSSTIAGSFDLQVTLPAVGQLLVGDLADYCVIDLVHVGQFERVVAVGPDPTSTEILRCASEYPPGPRHPNALALRAVERREQVVVEDLDLSSYPPDDRARKTAEQLGVRSMLVTPLIARDRIVGALSLSIGPSKRAIDDEMRRLASDVADRIALGIDNARLYAAAQHAIRARDELIAVVSHDLRNPLGVVMLALQMVENDPDSLPAALPRAQRAAQRMNGLIEDLLDIARIETGSLHVELEDLDLAGFLDETFEQHRALAAARNITLTLDPDDVPRRALADRNRLGQAVSNLIGNALKFTPAGGTIRLGTEQRGHQVLISVSDTGPGIAAEHLGHIFDRFWQQQRRKDGVGLGLAIVKGIVDAHGGDLSVESEVGSGSTFRIGLAIPTGDRRGGHANGVR
ncbi:MAG: response regulator [Deltaproteobacteria bacterium]|nr:response regulator [Deltaproteobacteria bacterium]